MNEVGVDPGIDHMLAMQCFDEIRQLGGKVCPHHTPCHRGHEQLQTNKAKTKQNKLQQQQQEREKERERERAKLRAVVYAFESTCTF